jgi:hypothetical protein
MGVAGGPNIIRDSSLIVNLDAADKNSYPGSGTDWYDLSGNGNHGLISTGEFVSSGNYLRNYANTSNFFTITIYNTTTINNTFSVTTGGWTIEEIIWTNSVNYPEADGGSVVSNAAYGGGATGFDWNHGNGLSSVRFGMSSNSAGSYEDDVYVSTGAVNSTNAWRVRTMIWDRGNNQVKLYMNGIYSGYANTPNTAGTSIYDGGGLLFGSLYGWKHYGRRASIKIYNKVLSADEVAQNFNSQRFRFNL